MDVLERDEHGLLARERAEDAEESGRDRARLWIGPRLGEEERGLERATLRTRQAGQHVGDARLEEIGERRVRELRLRRDRLRREDEVRVGGSDDRASPQRRLADPGFAFEHERRRQPAVRREEPVEVRQLLLPADDGWRAADG